MDPSFVRFAEMDWEKVDPADHVLITCVPERSTNHLFRSMETYKFLW